MTHLKAGTSRSVDDFLKKLYMLQTPDERVGTNELAQALGITAASITDMAQKLHEAQLIDYRKYYGVRLTKRGKEIALRVLRRHRLIELFLVQSLGYSMHEIHEEAERLEHAVSDRFIESLAASMNQPTHDPHGEPIPSALGVISASNLRPLGELPSGSVGTIRGLNSEDNHLIMRQQELGLHLGARVMIEMSDLDQSSLDLRVDNMQRSIEREEASGILVEEVKLPITHVDLKQKGRIP